MREAAMAGGIRIDHGEYFVMSNNSFTGSGSGTGIDIGYGENVLISDNLIQGYDTGVHFDAGKDIGIRNNKITRAPGMVGLRDARPAWSRENRFKRPDAEEAIRAGDVAKLLEMLELPPGTNLRLLKALLRDVSRKPANRRATSNVVSNSGLWGTIGRAADLASITSALLQLVESGLLPLALAAIVRALN
jgi:hypothetical protein